MRDLNAWNPVVPLLAIAGFTGCGGGAPAPDSAMGRARAAAATNSRADTPAVVTLPPMPDSMLTGDATRVPAGGAPRQPAASRPPSAPVGRNPTQRPPAASDTVRGIVSEVGSFPMTSVVVRPATGGSVTITGPLAREIARAGGTDVWVSGSRSAQGLEARAYAVRSVDGEPVADGILARDGDRIVLVTPAGRRTIAQPLQALRGMIGARVWLVGPLDGTIVSYGVLREP